MNQIYRTTPLTVVLHQWDSPFSGAQKCVECRGWIINGTYYQIRGEYPYCENCHNYHNGVAQ